MDKTQPLRPIIRLDEQEFKRLGEFIHAEYGIKMPPVKKTMLETRLQKRLRALGISSFKEYFEYLFSPEGVNEELVQMVNVVTTNKTDFFREPAHFDYMTGTALPTLIDAVGSGVGRPLNVWSAGCSTGEEPYTLAMVLDEYQGKVKGFRFTILATDISTTVLDKAAQGIYHEDRVAHVSEHLKKKYILKSKDRAMKLVRVVPALRSHVRFRRLNFMDGDFGMREQMDIIFCRNVIIYFDRPTQEKLLNRLCGCLIPGGYMFMGHSETLNGLNIPLYPVAPTVYRKPDR